MAKQGLTPFVRKRVKFDEAMFFNYLRENASPKLRAFLRSIDSRARVEMASYIVPYLRGSEEQSVLADRRRRSSKIKKAMLVLIRSLRTSLAKYEDLASIEITDFGQLGKSGSTLLPIGLPFTDVLKSEVVRLTNLFDFYNKLYN